MLKYIKRLQAEEEPPERHRAPPPRGEALMHKVCFTRHTFNLPEFVFINRKLKNIRQ